VRKLLSRRVLFPLATLGTSRLTNFTVKLSRQKCPSPRKPLGILHKTLLSHPLGIRLPHQDNVMTLNNLRSVCNVLRCACEIRGTSPSARQTCLFYDNVLLPLATMDGQRLGCHCFSICSPVYSILSWRPTFYHCRLPEHPPPAHPPRLLLLICPHPNFSCVRIYLFILSCSIISLPLEQSAQKAPPPQIPKMSVAAFFPLLVTHFFSLYWSFYTAGLEIITFPYTRYP